MTTVTITITDPTPGAASPPVGIEITRRDRLHAIGEASSQHQQEK